MSWIEPDWPAPPSIRALSTTRIGGVSRGAFGSLNLAAHVGDDPQAVARNRRILVERAALPSEPRWLRQVHGRSVAVLGYADCCAEADVAMTDQAGIVCAVLTADCLPVLVCDTGGRHVAAIHAGWRGLAAGVIEGAIETLDVAPRELLAWLGPAIGPAAFEVGPEVRDRFVAADPAARLAFRSGAPGRWLADLHLLARQRLERLGVTQVWGDALCTFSNRQRFFSYRRDGTCGRMATLIWRASDG
jgi:YfiH family protein